jgi:hypothetical protein
MTYVGFETPNLTLRDDGFVLSGQLAWFLAALPILPAANDLFDEPIAVAAGSERRPEER